MDSIGCIYLITNTINGRRYVGRTIHKNPKIRFSRHWQSANGGSTTPLHAAMRKYGRSCFILEVLCLAPITSLNNMEAYWADMLETYMWDSPLFHLPGYNACWCGSDIKLYEKIKEFREKITVYRTSEKPKKTNKGRKHTEEAKLRMSKSHIGYKPTAETIEKAKEKRIESMVLNGAKGVKLNKEDVLNIVKYSKDGKQLLELSKLFNVRESVISRILNGQRWGHVSGIPHKCAKRRGHQALGFDKAQEIRNKYSINTISYGKLALEYNVTKSTIANIINGKLYKISNES